MDPDCTKQLCCIFDGFLLENNATLVGLGVVGGDTILVFPKDGSADSDTVQTSTNSVLTKRMKLKKRIAEEFSVGLNVLFGEEEEYCVLHSEDNSHMSFLEHFFEEPIRRILLTYGQDVIRSYNLEEIRLFAYTEIYEMCDVPETKSFLQFLPDLKSKNDKRRHDAAFEVLEFIDSFMKSNYKITGRVVTRFFENYE